MTIGTKLPFRSRSIVILASEINEPTWFTEFRVKRIEKANMNFQCQHQIKQKLQMELY